MSILSPQKDTHQSHSQQSIYNLSRSNIRVSQKYIPNAAPATGKGHMKRQQQCLQNTKDKVKTDLYQIEYERDMSYPIVK